MTHLSLFWIFIFLYSKADLIVSVLLNVWCPPVNLHCVRSYFSEVKFSFLMMHSLYSMCYEDFNLLSMTSLYQVPLKTEFHKSHTVQHLPSSRTKRSTSIFSERALQMCTKLLFSLHSSGSTSSRKLARWLQMIFMANNLLICLRRRSPVWLMCRSVWSADNALT